MARELNILSDPRIRAWIKAGEPVAKADGGGLTFTLSKAGAAVWIFRYRHGGRRREVTLGHYGDIGLQTARKKAIALRAAVADGRDPAGEKRRTKIAQAATGTFSDLADDYATRRLPDLSASTQRDILRYLAKDILPRIGHLKSTDVLPAEIIHLVERVEKRSPTVARRVFEIVSVIFAHGVAKKLVETNPCASLKVTAILGARKPTRTRVKLTASQLKLLLPALAETGRSNELALKILLATCLRKNELIRARWEHVDLDNGIWRIPDAHSKNKIGFEVPLAFQVQEWFLSLKELAGDSPLVLPSRIHGANRRDKTISVSTLNATIERLIKRLDCGFEFAPHDLRSTAKSYLAELGVDPVVSELCLNHRLRGLEGIYNRHSYFKERGAALTLWANCIAAFERGEDYVAPNPSTSGGNHAG
jgi:integrase